jgi:histidine ammonia-lyase
VVGAARDTLAHAWRVLETEINAATDNPLIFPPAWVEGFEGTLEAIRDRLTEAECVEAVFSGGNFHGEPIAVVMDFLKIALAEVGNISERRTAHLVDGHLNQGLPSLLIERSGLNNGLMIPQYTAAALVSENKVLAHPASVDSIPTCENTEDHVSMGTIAARQAREILHNVELTVAIECFTAFQALHFRRPFQPGAGIQAFVRCLSEHGMTFLDEDRVLYLDIERACGLIRREVVVDAVERHLGRPLAGVAE